MRKECQTGGFCSNLINRYKKESLELQKEYDDKMTLIDSQQDSYKNKTAYRVARYELEKEYSSAKEKLLNKYFYVNDCNSLEKGSFLNLIYSDYDSNIKLVEDLREEFGTFFDTYTERKINADAEINELQKKYDKEFDALNEEYQRQLGELLGYDEDVSFGPLALLMIERNLSFAKLSEITGVGHQVCERMIRHNFTEGVNTDTLTAVASGLKVPFSEIIKFNNYDIDDRYVIRYNHLEEFIVPDEIKGTVSYKPLYELIESWDKYSTVKQGLIDVISSAEGVRERDNASDTAFRSTLTKIHMNQSMSLKNVYNICKYCRCSVDFVMTWE